MSRFAGRHLLLPHTSSPFGSVQTPFHGDDDDEIDEEEDGVPPILQQCARSPSWGFPSYNASSHDGLQETLASQHNIFSSSSSRSSTTSSGSYGAQGSRSRTMSSSSWSSSKASPSSIWSSSKPSLSSISSSSSPASSLPSEDVSASKSGSCGWPVSSSDAWHVKDSSIPASRNRHWNPAHTTYGGLPNAASRDCELLVSPEYHKSCVLWEQNRRRQQQHHHLLRLLSSESCPQETCMESIRMCRHCVSVSSSGRGMSFESDSDLMGGSSCVAPCYTQHITSSSMTFDGHSSSLSTDVKNSLCLDMCEIRQSSDAITSSHSSSNDDAVLKMLHILPPTKDCTSQSFACGSQATNCSNSGLLSLAPSHTRTPPNVVDASRIGNGLFQMSQAKSLPLLMKASALGRSGLKCQLLFIVAVMLLLLLLPLVLPPLPPPPFCLILLPIIILILLIYEALSSPPLTRTRGSTSSQVHVVI